MPSLESCQAGRTQYFVRCFVFSPLVFTDALLAALGHESGSPEEAEEEGEAPEPGAVQAAAARPRRGRHAALAVPARTTGCVLTATLAVSSQRRLSRLSSSFERTKRESDICSPFIFNSFWGIYKIFP